MRAYRLHPKLHRLTTLIFVLSLLFALAPASASDEGGNIAEHLSAQCTISTTINTSSNYYITKLTDDDTETAQRIAAGRSIRAEWDETVPVRRLFIQFYYEPASYLVRQYDLLGEVLSEGYGELFWNVGIDILDGAYGVEIVALEQEIALCSFKLYGEGEVPNCHDYEPTLEKADYMLIAMHPDDDVLFLGAIIPIYGAEQGRQGIALYVATRYRIRKDEALNGAWVMGLRNMPILGDFEDIPSEYKEQNKDSFTKAMLVSYFVEQLRKYRPEVVISQDVNGEYGHWQHILMVDALMDAVPLANDPEYDAASLEKYGTWEVKKLYLHLYEENKLSLPVNEPLSAFGGMTAVEVAREAFACHTSQQSTRHAVTNEGIYSLSDFGLAYTTVGLDTEGVNDMFENIDPSTISSHVLDTPTPMVTETAPTPATSETTLEPSAEPTETPESSDEPTETSESSAVPTETPDASVEPMAETEEGASPWTFWAVAGAALAVAVFAVCLIKRHRGKGKHGS
ncbi:MAG: PIG-L family deacetylase [Clostridia bacterium]|nr:PIG-L family deacetylase [Clostridia bacterium]